MKINKELLENKKIDDILKELRSKDKHGDGYLTIEIFLKELEVNTYYDLALIVNDRNYFKDLFFSMFPEEYDIFTLEEFAYNYLLTKVYLMNEVTSTLIYTSDELNFSFIDYLDYDFQDYKKFASTFELTDKSNTINDLWLRSPLATTRMPNITIYDIKNTLKKCDQTGSISPLIEMGIDFNMSKILIKSLKPYTEQVLRQSITLGEEGLNTNLLKVNRQDKIGLVYRDLESIIEYLMHAKSYQGGEFIFGRFSDIELKHLEQIRIGTRGKVFNRKREQVVKSIADAFTLPELWENVFSSSNDILADKCVGPHITRKLKPPISRLYL